MNFDIYYEDIYVGSVMMNGTMSLEQALELILFDEEKFMQENGFDSIDYADFEIRFTRPSI